MGIKIGNTWSSNGEDYGTQFKKELELMNKCIMDMIEDLDGYKKTIDNNSANTKITEDTIDLIDGMIKKLESSKENIGISITSIKYYDGGY